MTQKTKDKEKKDLFVLTVRGEPLVEIESRWQIDQLAKIRFGHFTFEYRRLEVKFVLSVAVLAVSSRVRH